MILAVWMLISKRPLTEKKTNLIRWNLLCYYIPLVVYHCIEPFSIRRYDTPLFIIPEIIFLVLSIVLFMQTFGSTQKITAHNLV